MGFLNKKIFNNSGKIFGLDLSDLSVKTMMLDGDKNGQKIISYSNVQMPVGCIIDGQIIKKEQVVEIIKRAVASSGPKKIKTKKVICSLPETKAFLRIVTIPKMEDSEIKEAIKWEIEANIPLMVDQVYYDWQVLEENFSNQKNKINVLVVAIAKIVVDDIVSVLEDAGLEPVGLEIESVAQTRSLLDENILDKTVLIVDVGDRRTSFSISKGGIPCFTSSIPLSGQSITETISKGMAIKFEEAEKIKYSKGIGDYVKKDALFKLTMPLLENFIQEIERSIDFYLTGLKYSKNIDNVIICGGGANTKGLIEYLSKKIGRNIEIGNSCINLKNSDIKKDVNKNCSVQYSTAVGLALKGLHYEDIS